MLLSVWFLPQYLGSGALIVGMALNYVLVAVCSLILLKKRTVLGSGKYCLKLLLVVIPTAVAGYFVQSLLMRVLSYVPATIITLILMLAIEAVLLWALKLFDFKAFFTRFLPQKLHLRKKARAHK